MNELEGKTALITGGSRGIGKGIARCFVEAGASVMLVSRKGDACEAAARELGGETAWCAGHVGKPEDAEATIDATLERFGRLDVLVNNAATNPWNGRTVECDLANACKRTGIHPAQIIGDFRQADCQYFQLPRGFNGRVLATECLEQRRGLCECDTTSLTEQNRAAAASSRTRSRSAPGPLAPTKAGSQCQR